MESKKPKVFVSWLNNLASQYVRYVKESKKHRCKLVGCEVSSTTQEVQLHVMVSGVKSQIIKFTPQELVTSDDILREFSQTDVRAITFYAFQQQKKQIQPSPALMSITAQEVINGKTIFIMKHHSENTEIRKSAHEIYADHELLAQFSFDDLLTIISSAVQEQTIEDMEGIYN